MNTTQYRKDLKTARKAHDIRFEVDNPKPRKSSIDEATGIERAINHLWIAWLVIALAGAIISMPHTLSACAETVHLPLIPLAIYSAACFVGVELGLISVALVTELKRDHTDPGPAWSLSRLVDWILDRIGYPPLVLLLFLAALTFNMADALTDSSTVKAISKPIAGALGPLLLLIAGHRFAHEIVQAATIRQRHERAHANELAAWSTERDQSWSEFGDTWIQQTSGEDLHTSQDPLEATRSGNGHRAPAPAPR